MYDTKIDQIKKDTETSRNRKGNISRFSLKSKEEEDLKSLYKVPPQKCTKDLKTKFKRIQ